MQLKVLQTLPSLFQHYADQLSGGLLASTLEICATLQNSKISAVSNTAAATLQQLVVSVFERVSKEDGPCLCGIMAFNPGLTRFTETPGDVAIATTVHVEKEQISISASAHDALRVKNIFNILNLRLQLTFS